jgi:hypothetical protein
MKKITLFLLVVFALSACGTNPQTIADSWQEALNKGDIDTALSYLAENAAVTISPPGPDGDGVYIGHAEIRGWYETIVSGKGVGALENCKADKDTLACHSTYTDEGLKSMGVDFVEGDWVAVLRDGKIQSYTFTISPESLAKFPPPPTEIPITEVRMTTAEAIAGKWEAKSGEYTVLHEFNPNSTLIVRVAGFGVISSGPYSFEDDLLKFDDRSGDCAGIVGKYEVYGTYEGDQLNQLRFVLVGEDACSDRRKTLNGNTMFPAD